MSEIIDRVAEAIWLVNKETNGLRFTELVKEMARAAIEAMREPSEGMICAGDERIIEHLNNHEITRADPTPAQNCFNAMIDAALNK